MTPEALIAQLRSTADRDERRDLTEAILELGYPWALELDAEDVALVRRQRLARASKVWLMVLWGVGSLLLGVGLANLGEHVEGPRFRTVRVPTTAREALDELNASRVARLVETTRRLLRERRLPEARAAAVRCLAIEHSDASQCAQLFVATLDGMVAARAQQRLREADDARNEMLAFVWGTRRWDDAEQPDDEAGCLLLMNQVRPIRPRGFSIIATSCFGASPPIPSVGQPSRESVLPFCAKPFLETKLEKASTGLDGSWDLHEVLVWQDAMETATVPTRCDGWQSANQGRPPAWLSP